ncbi:MAG: alkaline phosphatase family protein [Acidobacteriota bacterium]
MPRRILVSAIALLVLVACALLCVVLPRDNGRVVTVSRFGAGVRLLPDGLAFSALPLASRVVVPREGGGAVVVVPVKVPLAGGASLDAELLLRVEGSGTLPVAAGAVRARGWLEAWRERLEGQLGLTPDDAATVLAASPLWREIFPDAPTGRSPDVTARLSTSFSGARLASATLSAGADASVVRAAARQTLAARTARRGRLVLLGLDALDWKIVDELVGRGLMPNLAGLAARGSHAILDVPRPLISPIVWTTIATGQPAEVHGVLDFLETDPDGGNPRPVSGASRKVPALWELAAAAGRSSSVIGWWATFPAQAPPGATVYSDRLTEQLLGLSARTPFLADPPEADRLAAQLVMRASDLKASDLTPFADVSAEELAQVQRGESGWDEPVGGLAKLMAASYTVERLTRHELERGTEVVLSYLEGTDTVGHLYGPYRAPAMPGSDPLLVRRFGSVVDRYYAWVDRWVGSVVRALGPEDTVVIVSDHGFTWGDDRPRVRSGAHTATAVMWHRPDGAFVAAGPRVARSPKRQRMHVFEVAPALLALAGLPEAADMPRRSPEWLLAQRPADPGGPVRYASLAPREAQPRVELPPEAREEELAKLRALGYLAGPGTGTGSPAATAGSAAPVQAGPEFQRAEARRLSNLGASRQDAGELAGAEEAYRAAIAADPNYSAAHYNLNVILRVTGRLEEADRHFWIAVALGVREREMAVVQLALDYLQRGDPARAEAVFAEGRRRLPDAAVIWLNSGVFLGERGRLEEARTCLERAVALAPANPAAHRNLGTARLALGDRAGARAALAESLRLDPNQPEVRRQFEALGN